MVHYGVFDNVQTMGKRLIWNCCERRHILNICIGNGIHIAHWSAFDIKMISP